ncbi:MAG: helix-turn-helix transcriptional regulator [Aquabacterium sp.]|nr:helix-turn-helix transcriptional regulator [Aquabacterium sp.]
MKGRKVDLASANCGVARALQVVGDWWSLLIVREAFLGEQRFGQFQKKLGLAKNILSLRLKKLVEEGILEVDDGPAPPRTRRYLLTHKGAQLHVVLVALWQWGEAYGGDSALPPLSNRLFDRQTGLPLRPLEVQAENGRILQPSDLTLVADGAERPGQAPCVTTEGVTGESLA